MIVTHGTRHHMTVMLAVSCLLALLACVPPPSVAAAPLAALAAATARTHHTHATTSRAAAASTPVASVAASAVPPRSRGSRSLSAASGPYPCGFTSADGTVWDFEALSSSTGGYWWTDGKGANYSINICATTSGQHPIITRVYGL